MTRDEIKQRILDEIDDVHATTTYGVESRVSVIYTDAQLNDLVDEALELLVGTTKSVHRSVFVPIRNGGAYLYLPALAPDVMQITRIWNQSRNVRLDTTSIDNLSRFHQRFWSVTGNTEYWYTISWDLVGLFPRPTTGGGVLRIDYDAWPRALQSDTDTPELMNSSHDTLVELAAYFGCLKKWDANGAQVMAQRLRGKTELAKGLAKVGKVEWRHFDRTGPNNRSDYTEKR